MIGKKDSESPLDTVNKWFSIAIAIMAVGFSYYQHQDIKARENALLVIQEITTDIHNLETRIGDIEQNYISREEFKGEVRMLNDKLDKMYELLLNKHDT